MQKFSSTFILDSCLWTRGKTDRYDDYCNNCDDDDV